MRKLILLLCLGVSSTAWSSVWSHKAKVGFGLSDNVYFSNEDKQGDYFFQGGYSLIGANKPGFFTLWLDYRKYTEESVNDRFTWRMGEFLDKPFSGLKSWDMDLGVGGQHYPEDSPGTTEDSFDYVHLDASMIRTSKIQNHSELSIEPGTRVKFFTDFEGRRDQRLFVSVEANLYLNRYHQFTPYSELGVVLSNQDIYDNNYFQLGFDHLWKESKRNSFRFSGLFSYTTFPRRDVSVVTEVRRRRGQTQTTSQIANESFRYQQFAATWIRIYRYFQLESSVHVSSQKSKSGYVDFSESGFDTRLVYAF